MFWFLGAIGCSLLFAVPVLACLYYDADFLDLAAESIAYRYFFCVRVAEGETVVVAAGYLLGLLQQGFYSLLNWQGNSSPESLQMQIQGFALATNATFTLAVAGLLVAAFQSHLLQRTDKLLLALVALVPVWGTRGTGFYYTLLADYHFLNLVLVIAAVFFFQREWRRSESGLSGHLIIKIFLLGLFVGAMVANKVTLAVIGGFLFIPAFLSPPLRWWVLVERLATGGIGTIVGFLLVVWGNYDFRPEALGEMMTVWLSFVRQPGEEVVFWEITFWKFLFRHAFAVVVAFFALALTVLFLGKRESKGWTVTETVLATSVICGAMAVGYFVLKRPAGSTLFESFLILLALSVIVLTVASETNAKRWVIQGSCLLWFLLSFANFNWQESFSAVWLSRERAEAKWAHYAEVQNLAGDRKITVVFPDNSYHHEGVFEFLLKGAADFPTWRISEGGQKLLDRYLPGLSFRNEQGGPSPALPYDAGTVVVWYDLPQAESLLEKYPSLLKAIEGTANQLRRWNLEGGAGGNRVIAYASLLTSDTSLP